MGEIAMDTFLEALVSDNTDTIPEEYDWFAPLIGNWDLDYYDSYDEPVHRHIKGEWIFRRVLNGTGIEDLFICPSRATRISNPQPDGEYGAAIRMFNKNSKCYDMVYTTFGYMVRLVFTKENDMLVGTLLEDKNAKWVFKEIADNTFHWQNITVLDNGEWRVNNDIFAKRKYVNK